MITLNNAKKLALEGAARVTGRSSDDLCILDEATACKRTGWFFRYESRAFVETGDVAHAIGQAGPVIVTHRGVVHVFRDGHTDDEAIEEFDHYRAECTTLNGGT